MTETTKMYATATKGRAAVRRLRNVGVLAWYDVGERALVAYVTKFGLEPTRDAMRRALDPLFAERRRLDRLIPFEI